MAIAARMPTTMKLPTMQATMTAAKAPPDRRPPPWYAGHPGTAGVAPYAGGGAGGHAAAGSLGAVRDPLPGTGPPK
jgi:hypothetical protein